MNVAETRLAELGLSLPAAPVAIGSYVPVQVVGDLLYTSGVLPTRDGEMLFAGIVGGGLTVAQGVQAARVCALNILALVRDELGSLDGVRQMVQLTGFVRSAPGFAQQAKVLNGASDLLFEVLGERGRHARMALGTSDLPLGGAVELAAVVRIVRRD